MKKSCLCVFLVSLLLVFCSLERVVSAPQEPTAEKTVEQVFKNIQTLKGMPASQIYATMNFMKASLGVDCQYCHVRDAGKWDFASDAKPTKGAARRMISMVLEVNKVNFGGEKAVTCFTCHRGQSRPGKIPMVLQAKSETESKSTTASEKASLPEVDQVLAKYVEVLGGKAAIEKARTRVKKGTIEAHLVPSSPVEISQQAPDKILLVITTPKAVITQSYNGADGWVADPRGVRPLEGAALAALKREADFYRDVHLPERYSRMRVTGREKVRDHDAYVVEATTADHKTEKLYFDVQTGLLLRSVTFIQTMIGSIPETTDYDDYRTVDGVMIPFKRHREQLQGFEGSTLTFTEIKSNVEIDPTKFEKPAAKQ